MNAKETLGNKDTMTVFDKKWRNDAWKTVFIYPLISFLNDCGLKEHDFFASNQNKKNNFGIFFF